MVKEEKLYKCELAFPSVCGKVVYKGEIRYSLTL